MFYKEKNMEYKILNDGNKMPILGLGVFQVDPKETQRCVEDAISVGYRSIGVSNFYADRIVDLCENSGVILAVNQLECHPFYQREALKRTLDGYDIAFESWASFAEGQNDIFKNAVLSGIGEKYGKSAAQVILRWLIQRGIAVIPKNVKIERMRQDFDIFDFALSPEDMAAIAALDTDRTLFFDHRDDDKVKWLINWAKENAPKS